MKIKELIAELQKHDPETIVGVYYMGKDRGAFDITGCSFRGFELQNEFTTSTGYKQHATLWITIID